MLGFASGICFSSTRRFEALISIAKRTHMFKKIKSLLDTKIGICSIIYLYSNPVSSWWRWSMMADSAKILCSFTVIHPDRIESLWFDRILITAIESTESISGN
jgi:hypothetical protein